MHFERDSAKPSGPKNLRRVLEPAAAGFLEAAATLERMIPITATENRKNLVIKLLSAVVAMTDVPNTIPQNPGSKELKSIPTFSAAAVQLSVNINRL